MAERAKYCKCLYVHRKKSDDSIFYVGIGNKNRPYSKYRNNLWHKIVNKYGYYVEILMTGLSLEKAVVLEKDLISKYGRKDNHSGVLANLTDGGEGQLRRKVSKETIRRIKEGKAKGGMKGADNVIDVSTGKKYYSVSSACEELGLNSGNIYGQLKGKRRRADWNTIYYEEESKNVNKKVDTRSRSVIDCTTNKIYNSIKEASLDLSINIGTLSQHLNKYRYKESLKHIKCYA